MREIKFRAWDKQTNKMSPEFAVFGEFTLIGGVHAWQYENGHPAETSLEALGDLEIMQYTGLKDKNGKEIYEGDIVSYRSYWKTAHKTSEKLMDVIFEEGRFQLRFLINNNPAGDMMSVSQCGTIIGNIYENPELLKP